MKIKNLGSLHSVSSGKMVDPLTQTYFQAVALRLNNCLLLEPKRCIVAPKLAFELFPLKFDIFFRMKMFSGKAEMNMQKARSQASHTALCFKSWGLICTDPHLAPSRQSRQNLPNNWILPPRLWVSLPGLPSPYTHVPSRTVQVIWIQETYWAS